jgi:hypothetical protein
MAIPAKSRPDPLDKQFRRTGWRVFFGVIGGSILFAAAAHVLG